MRIFVAVALALRLLAPAAGHALTETDLPELLAAAPTDPGARVVQLSAWFLGTPYVAGTLGGGAGIPEQLTVRLDAVDCFTLLDYVEALRRSADPGEFPARLAEVRYRDGRIAWESRRHFFTDWAAAPGGRVSDVTAEVGGSRVRQTSKTLNRKAAGTPYLPGVAARERIIHFIPGDALDAALLDRLQPGDYLGIYAPEAGLDVSHVGIVVRAAGGLLLRHASAARGERRVVDAKLREYLAGKPGIVILRPR